MTKTAAGAKTSIQKKIISKHNEVVGFTNSEYIKAVDEFEDEDGHDYGTEGEEDDENKPTTTTFHQQQ